MAVMPSKDLALHKQAPRTEAKEASHAEPVIYFNMVLGSIIEFKADDIAEVPQMTSWTRWRTAESTQWPST